MKKLILITSVMLFTMLQTNAQQENSLKVDNMAVQTNNELNNRFSLLTKDELPQLKGYHFDDDKEAYLKKSRNQKTAAWVLIGVGGAAVIAGIIVESKNSVENTYSILADEKTNNTGTIIAVAGACMLVGSIPLFVASSRNKKKALLAMSTQKTGYGLPLNVTKSITGITLSIPIGN